MSIQQADPSISEVMLKSESFPIAAPSALFKTALEQMAEAKLGVVCVVNKSGNLLGVLTDGDVRRKLLTVQKPFSAFFSDDLSEHMTPNPVSITPDSDLRAAIDLMEQKQVWDLPVVDDKGVLLGLLHLHPIVKRMLG